MDKLHKKMVALGDMTQHTYESVVAACGEPKTTSECTFTDIGEGTRSTWTDGIFSITFNFDKDGKYCGIYDHSNKEPWLWMLLVTVVLVAGALICGAIFRNGGLQFLGGGSDSLSDRIIAAEDAWLTDDTAGASLIDLNGDGEPELLSVTTQFEYVEELEADFFGSCQVRIWSVGSDGVKLLATINPDGYCYSAALTGSAECWYYSCGGNIWSLVMDADGNVTVKVVSGDTDTSGGTAYKFMANESWVSAGDNITPDINADIAAMAEAWN